MFAAAHRRDELRADRAARAIAQKRQPAASDLGAAVGREPATLLPSVANRIQRLGGGSVPAHDLREGLDDRFGFDFRQVRIHADAEAASLAAMMGARAFTVGRDVVFGRGAYAPHTASGSRLLAHELAHVVQQSHNPTPLIQLVSLDVYNDTDPLHDPSRLTDAQIEATDEYGMYMAMNPMPIPQRDITPAEARMACRLLLRHSREVKICPVVTRELLMTWLLRARSRLATTATAEGTVGQQEWVAASAGDVQAPSTADSEFTRWMLGGGTEPDPATGRLNCWEMVLFSAYRAGELSEARMRGIYTRSRAAMTGAGGASDPMAFPRTLERLLRSSNEYIYDPADASSPRPLRGDMVIFKEAANHVALATGNRPGGRVEIVSHWPPPDGDHKVKITTIEALLPRVGVSVAKFWSPIW